MKKYRKKRKIEFSSEDLITLMRGGIDDYTKLYKSYVNKWNVDSEQVTMPLFALTGDEG